MCYFISGILPHPYALEDLNRVGKRFSLTFGVCENEWVHQQLGLDYQYLIKRAKVCDCQTELGAFCRIRQADSSPFELREVQKLRKKGWSEAKIKRWKKDKEKSHEKIQSQAEAQFEEPHPDATRWMRFVQSLFAHSGISSFGIMLHWYKGRAEDERIRIVRKNRIPVEGLSKDVLLQIEEDQVYEFFR